MTTTARISDPADAEHYHWGNACEGWHLLKHADLSIIRERVPPGAGEVRHFHVRARQFFFVLSGTATLEFDDGPITFGAGQGVHVEPGVAHRFANHSKAEVVFLVVSTPTTAGDRMEAVLSQPSRDPPEQT